MKKIQLDKTKSNIGRVEISRSDNGISVFIESAEIGRFIKTLTDGGLTEKFTDDNGCVFHVPGIAKPLLDRVFTPDNIYRSEGKQTLFYSDDLSAGFSREYSGIYTADDITEIGEEISKMAAEIYAAFCKPCKVEITIKGA